MRAKGCTGATIHDWRKFSKQDISSLTSDCQNIIAKAVRNHSAYEPEMADSELVTAMTQAFLGGDLISTLEFTAPQAGDPEEFIIDDIAVTWKNKMDGSRTTSKEHIYYSTLAVGDFDFPMSISVPMGKLPTSFSSSVYLNLATSKTSNAEVRFFSEAQCGKPTRAAEKSELNKPKIDPSDKSVETHKIGDDSWHIYRIKNPDENRQIKQSDWSERHPAHKFILTSLGFPERSLISESRTDCQLKGSWITEQTLLGRLLGGAPSGSVGKFWWDFNSMNWKTLELVAERNSYGPVHEVRVLCGERCSAGYYDYRLDYSNVRKTSTGTIVYGDKDWYSPGVFSSYPSRFVARFDDKKLAQRLYNALSDIGKICRASTTVY